MTNNRLRVGNVEIMALSDGLLEFDLCNFFPTIAQEHWHPYESYLTDEQTVRFNLGSYLIRSDGRTILVDTGLGPKPADAPDVPWGRLMHDFEANALRPEQVDMVVLTHLHRDLLPDRARESVLCFRAAVGRAEGPAPFDAGEESSGLRLEHVEYGVAL